MKKFLTLLVIFSAFMSVSVFADDSKGNWINWSPHIYNTYDNPLIGAGQNNGYRPWYVTYANDPSLGVVIAIPEEGAYIPHNLYYYVSYNSTFVCHIAYNNYGNDNHTVPTIGTKTLTRVTNSAPSIIYGLINKFSISEPIYYCQLDQPSYNPQVVDNADIHCTSINDLYSQMQENNFESGYEDPNALGGLPVLTYTTSTSSTYKFLGGFDKKAKLTWDFNEKEPYKNQPQDFCVDVTVSGHLNTAGPILTDDLSMDTDHKVVLTEGGCNVATNSFTWLYQATGLKYYKTYGLNEFPDHDNNAQGQSEGYRVYVRTRNVNTNESSAWKIYNFIGGIFSSAGYAQDDSNPQNPTIKPLQPDNSDNDDYSVKYDPDSSTDAQADPTGENYKGNTNYDPTTLFNNLKAAVNSISELPSMFAQVVTFVPEWLVSLIFISIGMLVVIGLVKIIIT